MPSEVSFSRMGISLPCPVPVLPGTPHTMDADGEAIPLDQRTEACAVDAFWAIGGQPVCIDHLREACRLLEIDVESIIEEAGGLAEVDTKPWAERHRYDQKSAKIPGLPWETE